MSDQTIERNGISTWNIDPAHTVAEFKVRHMANFRHLLFHMRAGMFRTVVVA